VARLEAIYSGTFFRTRCSKDIARTVVTCSLPSVVSVIPSICPVFFITFIERAAHTQRDSLGAACDVASVHSDNKEDRYTCYCLL